MEQPLPLPAGPAEAARLVTRAWEAFRARDVAAFRALVTDDLEFHAALGQLDAEEHRGVAGMERWLSELWATWEHIEGVPEQVLQIDDHLLSVIRLEARGLASGVEVSRTMFQVAALRDGRLAFVLHAFDAGHALRELARRLDG